MKKTLILLILSSLIIGNAAYAEYSYVDSSDFTGDAFFTPPALQEKQEEAQKANDFGRTPTPPPLKKLRLKIKKKLNERDAKKMELAPTAPQEDVYAAGAETSEYASQEIKDDFDETMMPDGFEADEESLDENKNAKRHFWQRKPKEIKSETPEESDNIILDCERVDYDTDSYSVVANGNAVVTFVKQDTTVKADKITYDRMNNTIKAEGNVRIIKNGQTINGEYIFVDLNEENALIEKPIAQTATVEIKSEKGYVYGDRVVQENGSLTVDQSFPINFRTVNSGPLISTMLTPKNETLTNDMASGRITLKAKNIKITQKGDLIVADIKKASLFRGDKKIIKLPPVKVYTNKNFDFAETASWELGSIRGLGMYLGPGHVFEIPGGSVLKVMPILNYNHGFGIGGIARYSSASNWTQAAYGTADSKFLIRGKQKLDDHLYLQYVMNVAEYETVFRIVLLETAFYMTFLFNSCIFDSTFYGLGKTHLMLIQSICIDGIYYGTMFVLYLTGLFVPSLLGICLMFGIGMALDFIPTMILYIRMLKKENIKIDFTLDTCGES